MSKKKLMKPNTTNKNMSVGNLVNNQQGGFRQHYINQIGLNYEEIQKHSLKKK